MKKNHFKYNKNETISAWLILLIALAIVIGPPIFLFYKGHYLGLTMLILIYAFLGKIISKSFDGMPIIS